MFTTIGFLLGLYLGYKAYPRLDPVRKYFGPKADEGKPNG